MVTIALVGCSKTKAVSDPSGYAVAKDLYVSDLFSKRVEHVEGRGLPWYILSAKCGLLKPTVQLRSYDKTIGDLSNIEVAEWHLGVANQLMSELWYEFRSPKLSSVSIEMHAGAKYCEPLGAILQMFGLKVIKPVAKRGIGQQLAFYKSN
jgi:hypothetical protein